MGVTEASNCREAQFCVSSTGRALAWPAIVLSAPCDGDPARPVRGAHSPLPSTAVRIAAAAAAPAGPAAPCPPAPPAWPGRVHLHSSSRTFGLRSSSSSVRPGLARELPHSAQVPARAAACVAGAAFMCSNLRLMFRPPLRFSWHYSCNQILIC